MAHYWTSRFVPKDIEETFDFVSDFRHAASWDPRTLEVEKTTEGPVGLGTSFRLVGKSLGMKLDLPYTIVAYEHPRRLALEGENTFFRYRDEIGFSEEAQGTRFTYNARLSFKGILKIGNPFLQLMFKRIGDDATEGIVRALETGTAPAGH